MLLHKLYIPEVHFGSRAKIQPSQDIYQVMSKGRAGKTAAVFGMSFAIKINFKNYSIFKLDEIFNSIMGCS